MRFGFWTSWLRTSYSAPLLQEVLTEKMAQYMDQSGSRPASEALAAAYTQLLAIHSNLPHPAEDFHRLAQHGQEVVSQLERQLDFANAAQKALADMYIGELDANKCGNMFICRSDQQSCKQANLQCLPHCKSAMML